MTVRRMLPEARTTPSPDAGNELALIAALRAGDEATCEARYLAHHDALWRFAYARVRPAEVAEERVHEVFLAPWRDRAQWEVRTSVRARLYGAVRNQALTLHPVPLREITLDGFAQNPGY